MKRKKLSETIKAGKLFVTKKELVVTRNGEVVEIPANNMCLVFEKNKIIRFKWHYSYNILCFLGVIYLDWTSDSIYEYEFPNYIAFLKI
jgi:hypothetical protein